eukprot:1899003-Pyramimonas_sp.AAC.3
MVCGQDRDAGLTPAEVTYLLDLHQSHLSHVELFPACLRPTRLLSRYFTFHVRHTGAYGLHFVRSSQIRQLKEYHVHYMTQLGRAAKVIPPAYTHHQPASPTIFVGPSN